MANRLLASISALALLTATPALAQSASGGPPATYADQYGHLQTASAAHGIGRENGTGAQCLMGYDVTCAQPVYIEAGGSLGVSNLPATVDTNTGPASASTLRTAPATNTTSAPVSPAITGPTSTLTLPSTTTAYAAGNLIANSATAGSVVVPSFNVSNAAGGAAIARLRLSTNDNTSTAWPGVGVQVDLWLAAPTFTNGDRGAFLPATGTANHLGSFTCTMSAEYGDGAYGECSPSVGSFALPKLASGTAIYWTLQATTASGVTGASKVWTLTAELLN